jgi:hypothetical protein
MPTATRQRVLAAVYALAVATTARAASIVVHLPPAAHAASATATAAKDPSVHLTGTVAGDTVTLADVKPGLAYDLRVALADGAVLQGVDLGWYSRVPEKPHPEPLTDDDRSDIGKVLTIMSFFNHTDAVIIRGTHNRAVMLVDQRRDTPFHSDAGGEVIWGPELWYFENHHGGWEKVLQANRELGRQRFKSAAAYHAVVDHLRWVPELGGLKVRPGAADLDVTLPASAGVPATQPSSTAGTRSAPPP